jgi:hypothetical protein
VQSREQPVDKLLRPRAPVFRHDLTLPVAVAGVKTYLILV